MSNDIYDIARYRFATAQLNWTTVPLRLLAFSGTPDFNPDDTSVNNITDRAEMVFVKESQAVVHATVSQDGYLQTDQIVIPVAPVGVEITSFVFVVRAASVPTSVPLLFFDDALNLPFTANGLDIVVTPDWLQQRGWGRV